MADIRGSYTSNPNYTPRFTYNINYSETGRSANAVSYRFDVSYSRSNGWHGYDIIVNWDIGGVRGSRQIKGTYDSASGSVSFNLTCSTNASGGTVGARIWTTSNTDSTHYQNSIDTGGRTVNKSTFNTPPTISGTVSISPSGTIPENTSTITMTSPVASDRDNNLAGYRFRVSINGGGWTEIGRGSSRTLTYNCSGYGEGTTFKFVADAYDSYGMYSGNAYSSVVTKNLFANSTIQIEGRIGYSDSNQTVKMTIGESSNSDGSSTRSRSLTCDGIAVYNGSNLNPGITNLTIYKSGSTPTGPYIKLSDVLTKMKPSKYIGSLTFNIISINTYGTSKTSSTNVDVNLRTNPNPVVTCQIKEDVASTAYKVTTNGTGYFIPDSGRVIQVAWNGGSGKLGEEYTYSLYVSYGSGGWELLVDNMRPGTTLYNHQVPRQSSMTSIRYKVRVTTEYGMSAEHTSPSKYLHHYSKPGITPGLITRGSTTCEAIVTIKTITSISGITTTGNWICYNKGTTTIVSQGNLLSSQNAQTIRLSGLTDSRQYDLKVSYNDSTGFSTSDVYTISISANSPMAFINKYGLGVGGVKANTSHAMNVKGNGFISGNLDISGNLKAVEVYAGVNKVYHPGNKPTASQIGALSSSDTSIYATANKIIKRDSSGDATVKQLKTEAANFNTMSGALAFRVNNNTDNAIKFCSDPGPITGWLGLGSFRTTQTYSDFSAVPWGNCLFRVSGGASNAPSDRYMMCQQICYSSDECVQIAWGLTSGWTLFYRVKNRTWGQWKTVFVAYS